MNALTIALTIVCLVCLWILAIFVIKKYMSPPRKEKFIVNRLTRVPQMYNSETHDVLAYSLGYS